MQVRKAIIPAAGMGTRFLPATKSMPKEMLPIVDKPVLQYVIEEAVASGIEDVLIVTGRGKQAIENHFDYNPDLENFLVSAGKRELVEQVRAVGHGVQIHYIRQKEQLGLGDAVRLGAFHCAGEPFAVLLGDAIIDPAPGHKPGLAQLLDVFAEKNSSVVAVRRVPREAVSKYGVVDGAPVDNRDDLLRLKQLVEKPAVDKAPSNLAIAARYVFTPEIFACIAQTSRGVGGEFQLTDAMNLLARTQPMYALLWKATRYDIGNRAEYAKCFLDFALRHPATAEAVRTHIRSLESSL